MSWVIRILDSALPGAPCPERGMFVKSMDFRAVNGHGSLVVTNNIKEAMLFASVSAALTFYQTIPSNHPIRESDGRPNRPMTAFNIEVLQQ